MQMLQRAVTDRHTTVVIVSHDIRIAAYADRVFHLEDGLLLESDVSPEPATGNGT